MPEPEESSPTLLRPPIGEVALVLQFKSLSPMRNVDFFRLWNMTDFKELYPVITEYPEMPEFSEVFGVPRQSGHPHQFVFEMSTGEVLRYNFRNEERSEQIQIQRDRIAFYWQKNDSNSYPRFQYIHETFLRDFRIFSDFIDREKLGEIRPNQCAISYNNDILKDPKDAENVVTFFRNPSLGGTPMLNKLEDVTTILKSVIESDGRPIARMYVSFATRSLGKKGEEQDALGLELIVRGPPDHPNVSSASEFFKMGHQQIWKTFLSITTKAMQEAWERQ